MKSVKSVKSVKLQSEKFGGLKQAVSYELNACEIRITDFTDFTDQADLHQARLERDAAGQAAAAARVATDLSGDR